MVDRSHVPAWVAISLAVVSVLWPDTAPAQETNAPLGSLIVVGESFSACRFDGSPRGFCWPEIVQYTSAHSVYNLAVGGNGFGFIWDSVAHNVLDPLYCSKIPPYRDLCWGIIMMGFSDASFGRTASDISGYHVSVTNAMEAVGVTHTLIIIEPVDPPNLPGVGLTPATAQALRDLCDGNPARWSCLDLSQMPLELFPSLPDGKVAVHPTDIGQVWIADRVTERLGELGFPVGLGGTFDYCPGNEQDRLKAQRQSAQWRDAGNVPKPVYLKKESSSLPPR